MYTVSNATVTGCIVTVSVPVGTGTVIDLVTSLKPSRLTRSV